MPRLEGLGSLRAEGLPESLCCCYPSLYHHHQGTGTCTYLTLGRSLVGWEEPSLAVGSQDAPVPTSSTAGNKVMAASFTQRCTLAAAVLSREASTKALRKLS